MNKWRKPLSILTVIAVVAVSGVTWLTSVVSAAGGQMYQTVSSSTVTPGGSVTVNVRINPATPTDTVNVILNYDSSKMTYSSVSYAGSPFDQHFGFSASGGQVTFAAAILGNSVSTDSAIAQITFTAATGSGGSGVASFNLNGSNAAYAGTATNPTIAAASSVTFVCPSGQTGTPPSCSTPSPTPTPTPTPTPSPTPSPTPHPAPSPTPSPSKTTTKGGSTSTSGGGTGSTTTTNTQPIGTPALITGSDVQYTKVSIVCTTKTAQSAYVRYGLDGNLTTNSPASASGTDHTLSLDPATLVPGQTYSYVVVSTDASGKVSQTEVRTFKTKGMQVTLTVVDKNHKPIKGKNVTLHSSPMTAKTDGSGNVTFSDVPLGLHDVVYTAGKKTYTQQITVVNNVQTVGEKQSADPQTFSIVYGFTQSSINMLWVWLAVVILIIGALVALAQMGRLGFAMQLSHNYKGMSSPVVVGGNSSSPHRADGSSLNDSERASVQEHLNAIPNPQAPSPGSTVSPKANKNDDMDGRA